MGDACSNLELYEEAKTWYRKATALNPRYSEAWLNMATILMELGNWTDAERALRKTIELDPNLDEAFLYLANCQLRQNQPTEAKKTLHEALIREPGEFQTYVALSDCCLRLGDLEGAIKACEDALEHVIEMEELDILIESLRGAGLSQKRVDAFRKKAADAMAEGRVREGRPVLGRISSTKPPRRKPKRGATLSE